MLQQNFLFGMDYKFPIFNKDMQEQSDCYVLYSKSLTIQIDLNKDIQELQQAVDYCFSHPNEEKSWSNLDDLFQYGLYKHLTQEHSLLIIKAFYQYFQTHSFATISSIRTIQKCLQKYCSFMPPDFIDFLFRFSLSNINCNSKMSLIDNSLIIIYIILPFTNETQRAFFLQYFLSFYPKISLMDSFPNSSFLVCIYKYFEICSFAEALPSFRQLSHIIFSFLPNKLWGLSYEPVNIIETAILKDPNICLFILQPELNFIPILTELVSRKQEALSKISIDLFTTVINLLKGIPKECQEENKVNLILNITESSKMLLDFNNAAIKCLPTPFEKLEISIIRCITSLLQIGLDPSQMKISNLFDLFEKHKHMNYKHKKEVLSFASIALQKAPSLFLQPFIESPNSMIIELIFESIYDSDWKVLFNSLNITLILIRMRKLFLQNTKCKANRNNEKFTDHFLSVFDPSAIDLDEIKLSENEEIRHLAILIDDEINDE